MRDRSVRFKITSSAIICFVIGMIVILSTLFFYLSSAFTNTTHAALEEQGEKYSLILNDRLAQPISFLGGISSIMVTQIATPGTNIDTIRNELSLAFNQSTGISGMTLILDPSVFALLSQDPTALQNPYIYTYFRDSSGEVQVQSWISSDGNELDKEYYRKTIEQQMPMLSDPYPYTALGHGGYMITVAYPLVSNAGVPLGVVTADLHLEDLHDQLSEEKIYDTGYIVIVNSDGVVIYSPNSDNTGRKAEEVGLDYKKPTEEQSVSYDDVKSLVNGKRATAATVRGFGGINGGEFYVSIIVPNAEANAVYLRLLWIIGCIFIIIGLAIAIVISRRTQKILHPLNVMTELAYEFGRTGDLSYSSDEWERTHKAASVNDDVGKSLKLLLKMFGRLVYYGKALSDVAENNVDVTVVPLGENDTIGVSLRTMIDNLNEMLLEITQSAQRLEILADKSMEDSNLISRGAETQTADIKNLMDSVSSVMSLSEDTAAGSAKMLNFSEGTAQNLIASMQHMNNLGKSMDAILEAQNNIAGIIKVINDIAFQTNILSLNAAVEAARAGEAGRGFAVVADEVSALAAKSAEAARMTSELIGTSLAAVNEGHKLTESTIASMKEVRESGLKVTSHAKDISSSSRSQQEAIIKINKDIENISGIIETNSSISKTSLEQSKDLKKQASVLSAIIARFKLR